MVVLPVLAELFAVLGSEVGIFGAQFVLLVELPSLEELVEPESEEPPDEPLELLLESEFVEPPASPEPL